MNKNPSTWLRTSPSTRLRTSLDALLQECLAGLDAGLTPEECLSAWPEKRHELEPMLRQALLLRFAFASAPSEEFRARGRDKLMFAAGRDALRAFAAEPDSHFVQTTRQRLLNAAGATTLEALRAVPPPKLAFWVNARRRLLEAAAGRPAAAAPRTMAPVLRVSFSTTAVLVIALAVAGLAYFTSQSAKPTVGQEFATIEQELNQLVQQQQAGNPPPADALLDISRRYVATVEKLPEQPQPAIANKAAELFTGITAAAAVSPAASQQVAQQLAPVQEKVDRIFAARVDTPLSQPSTPPAPSASPIATDGISSSPVPSTATKEPPAATPVPLGPNQARLELLPDGWSQFSTADFSVEVPNGWQISGPTFGANGLTTLDTRYIIVSATNVLLQVNVRSSEIGGIVNGLQVVLRTEDGQRIPVDQLLTIAGGELAVPLNRILESVEYTQAAPTSTPPPTRTAALPTRTPTP